MNLDPETIAARLKDRRCLSCGHKGMKISVETGFTEHYCFHCKKRIEAQEAEAKKASGPHAAAYNRKHRSDGLDNLDRLLGNG